MTKYCSNCGNKINENADVCLKCGILINNQQSDFISKPTVPGKGLSIAGMVLGIISAFWALISFLTIIM